MSSRRRDVVLLASLACLCASASANAAVRYASPTGSGTACTQPSPCDIAEATRALGTGQVNPGDEIVIGTGTYTSVPEIDILDANVSIHGEAGQPRPRIVSGASAALVGNQTGIAVSHLEIVHTASSGSGLSLFAGSGTVDDVIVHSSSSGCSLNGTYTVRNSVCWGAGSGRVGISSLNGPSAVILRNVTAIATGPVNSQGLRVTASSGATTSVTATNVITRTTATDGLSFDIQATTSGSGSTATVTLDHSNYSSVFALSPATVTSPATNSNQTAAPIFLDAASGGFHETTLSPTVNAGADSALNGTADIDGEARATGTTDIGADEFVATDDDGDGIPNGPDACRNGDTGWTSNSTTDHDADGCRDAGAEDPDDDNDSKTDGSDTCPQGDVAWVSTILTDHDADGCRDAGEDTDDDNDLVPDGSDSCAAGETGWTSDAGNDHDFDGCRDAGEDTDDDNDTVADGSDSCARGDTAWTSDSTTDHDSDGCRDAGAEDTDDDNDSKADGSDSCPVGDTGWTSNASTDNDSDGCRDAGEDTDDDNDTVVDGSDNCALTANTDQADNDGDALGDVCDPDDDNDGVDDASDACRTQPGPPSNGGCPEVKDTTAPDTDISEHPGKRVFKRRARFELMSDDATAHFECSLDGAAFSACEGSVQFRVKYGKHTLAARAVDPAGNPDPSPASWTWKVKRRR